MLCACACNYESVGLLSFASSGEIQQAENGESAMRFVIAGYADIRAIKLNTRLVSGK